jgi:hypothetical protein
MLGWAGDEVDFPRFIAEAMRQLFLPAQQHQPIHDLEMIDCHEQYTQWMYTIRAQALVAGVFATNHDLEGLVGHYVWPSHLNPNEHAQVPNNYILGQPSRLVYPRRVQIDGQNVQRIATDVAFLLTRWNADLVYLTNYTNYTQLRALLPPVIPPDQ